MTLIDVFSTIIRILNAVIPVIVALGIVYFVWGVVQYVIGDGEEAKKVGRTRIIYGVVGLAIITGLWGLVNIILDTFGFGVWGGAIAPIGSAAGTCTLTKTFAGLAHYVTCTINNAIIPFMFAVALVFFVWGVVKYFFIGGDEESQRTKGKQFIIWGVVAITVMLCVWGLAKIVGSTFGVSPGELIKIPQTKE